MTHHCYHVNLTWNGGCEQFWTQSIRSAIQRYSAIMRGRPNAIGTIVGLRWRLK